MSFYRQLTSLLPGWNRKKLAVRKTPIISVDQQLQCDWVRLRQHYFPERSELDCYSVRWSPRRQRRTLASVNLRKKLVTVAQELHHPDFYQWIAPLLYHELCHAVLGIEVPRYGKRKRKRAWHGKEFRALESLHPLSQELDRWIKSGGWSGAVRSHRARITQSKIKARKIKLRNQT